MSEGETEVKVIHNQVKSWSPKYHHVIVAALHEGIFDELQRIKWQKNEIEAGIVVLLGNDKIIKKLKIKEIKILRLALNQCTFFNFEKTIKTLDDLMKGKL